METAYKGLLLFIPGNSINISGQWLFILEKQKEISKTPFVKYYVEKDDQPYRLF